MNVLSVMLQAWPLASLCAAAAVLDCPCWLCHNDAPTFAGDQECVFPGRLVVLRNTGLGFARKALVLQQLRDCFVVW
jgi:hypothetical protein